MNEHSFNDDLHNLDNLDVNGLFRVKRQLEQFHASKDLNELVSHVEARIAMFLDV